MATSSFLRTISKLDRWPTYWSAWILGISVAGAGAAITQYLDSAQAALQNELHTLTKTDGSTEPVAPRVALHQADFTSFFPTQPPVTEILNDLQRHAQATDVALLDVQLQERAATTTQLGQAELALQLRGSYSQIKQLVREVQSRYAFVTVRHWALKRAAPPATDTEASLTLVIWARPLPPPTPASAAAWNTLPPCAAA